MNTQAGIWIDRAHAIVVLLHGNAEEHKSFHARTPEPFPQTTETRERHEYTRNDFIAEDKLERKQTNARHSMFDSVMHYVSKADALYVLGPGEAKNEFETYAKSTQHGKRSIQLETSDKMTEPQLAAKVRRHFQE
jgi:hypothetical protein